jgi:hypothetical protein
LQWHGESRNFVQEKCAAIGQFNLAGARFGGAGERAAFAAEQFRLNQVFRQRRAIQADERLL